MQRMRRSLCCMAAALLLTVPAGGIPAGAQETAQETEGSFAERFPEKFSEDGTVIVTENSYRSHDVNITLSRHYSGQPNGDLNSDRTVDISDAILFSRLLAEDDVPAVTAPALADCDNDGFTDLNDLTLMLQYLSAQKSGKEFFTNRTLAYCVADIYVRDIHSLRGAFTHGVFPERGKVSLEPIKKMAADNNAILAINCDYCEIRNNGITYRNGVMYRETARAEVAVIYENGVMDVLTDAEYRALSDAQKAEIWQTTAFAPGLVKDGVQMTGITGSSVYRELHPRSGIGYFEPGHYCFVQADGRAPGYSDGVSLDEFAAIMYELGVQEGYNMDGGSSSEIVFMGQTYNRPSGVQVGSTGGRYNSDILYICNTDEIPEDTAAAAWLERQQAAEGGTQ